MTRAHSVRLRQARWIVLAARRSRTRLRRVLRKRAARVPDQAQRAACRSQGRARASKASFSVFVSTTRAALRA